LLGSQKIHRKFIENLQKFTKSLDFSQSFKKCILKSKNGEIWLLTYLFIPKGLLRFQKRIKKKKLFLETINHDFSFLSKRVCNDSVQETINKICRPGIESLFQDLSDILIDNAVR
jgi:hypothetical protein